MGEEEAKLGFFKEGKRARSCERPMPRPLVSRLRETNEVSTSRTAEETEALDRPSLVLASASPRGKLLGLPGCPVLPRL